MKKVLLTIIFVAFFFWLSSRPALAACNPPYDYSDCPVAQTGPKIARNLDPENYEQIRREYNAADPSIVNQWIPVTIIYTIEDLQPEHYENVKANLEAMRANGLLPVIRTWDSLDPDLSYTAAQQLNQLFAEVSFPQNIVYPFNEPNLAYGPYQGNSQVFASVLSSFIQGAGANPNFQIYFPPIAGHQGGLEYQFARDVLSYRMPDGRTIGEAMNGAAFTIYEWEPGQFQADFDQWVNLLREFGVQNFIISELGPYDYNRPSQPLLQYESDIDAWIAKMSEIFAAIKQGGLLTGAEIINTSFFLDTDGDGFPDVTLLVIIHADGTVEIIELLHIGGGWGWPPGWGRPFDLECQASAGGDRDSRPFGPGDSPKCDTCNQTQRLESSCATSATINDYAFYLRKDTDVECDGSQYVEKAWLGTVKVDPSDTKIPFVGKEEEEDVQLYLADHLDGITEYYKNYPLYWLDGVNNTGAWRKLTPMTYQDQLKEKLVRRAQQSLAGNITEGKIHDYKVEYTERLCWNSPFWLQVILNLPNIIGIGPQEAWKLADHCLYVDANSLGGRIIDAGLLNTVQSMLAGFNLASPFDIPLHRWDREEAQLTQLAGHFPPDPREFTDPQEYQAAWKEWQESADGRWFRLWQVVPMFSRENTPGFISPYIGQKEKDLFYTSTPDALIEKVPHVARLYEVSKAFQNMLLPDTRRPSFFSAPATTAQGPSEPSLASSSTSEVPMGETPSGRGGRLEVETSTGSHDSSEVSSEVEKIQWTKWKEKLLTAKNSFLSKLTHLTKKALFAQEPSELEEGQMLGAGTIGGVCLNMYFNTGYEEQGNNIKVFTTIIYEQAQKQDHCTHSQPLVNNALAPLGSYMCPGWGQPYTLVPPWNGTPFTLSPGECRSISFGYDTDNCDAWGEGHERFSTNCEFCFLNGEFTTTCGGPVGPPGVDTTCDPAEANPVNSCNEVGITGNGDTLCCDPIALNLRGVDKFKNEEYCKCSRCVEEPIACTAETCDGSCAEWVCEESEDCYEVCTIDEETGEETCGDYCPIVCECHDPCLDCATPKPVSREMGVGLSHPYLKPIWEQMSKADTAGIFNFFRPAEINPFQDIDAEDQIGYGYDSAENDKPEDCEHIEGNINPTTGKFFFPHLGGVQQAKEWLTGALTPQKSSLLELLGF